MVFKKGELAPKILDTTTLTMDDNNIYGYIDGALEFVVSIKTKEVTFTFIDDVTIPDETYYVIIEDSALTVEDIIYNIINQNFQIN